MLMVQSERIPCFKVHQWLDMWNITQKDADHKKPPLKHFYLFKMKAKDLQRLSGVNPRETTKRGEGGEDLNIQRKLDQKRLKEIKKFVKHGFPISTMKDKSVSDHLHLINPGWLPSTIIVNFRTVNDGLPWEVDQKDLLKISDTSKGSFLELPHNFGDEWEKKKNHPIQIIDGQHRLYAFENLELEGNFEFPVVAFIGLGMEWQAYLFWVINIKPKKINPSLAFDLYPLLRNSKWLDVSESENIYRQARAQDITENLWKYRENPWYRKINLLGEIGKDYPISQAAMVNALHRSYLSKRNGIFVAPLTENKYLPWGLKEEVALIALIWKEIYDYYSSNKGKFEYNLFDYNISLLMRDQGVSGILKVTNDILKLYLTDYTRKTLEIDVDIEEDSTNNVVNKIKLKLEPLHKFIQVLSKHLCSFEWRNGESEVLKEPQLSVQRSYKGSGGYSLICDNLIKHLAKSNSQHISKLASKLKKNRKNDNK